MNFYFALECWHAYLNFLTFIFTHYEELTLLVSERLQGDYSDLNMA